MFKHPTPSRAKVKIDSSHNWSKTFPKIQIEFSPSAKKYFLKDMLDQNIAVFTLCTLILNVNPRPYSVFCHLRPCRGGGGGWCDPPWRSAPDGRRVSRKKPVDAPRRDLAIAHIVFGPRLIFDLVSRVCHTSINF